MNSKGNSLKRKHVSNFLLEGKNTKEFVPWVEEFSPACIEELAVHKKKVYEVQAWIQKSLSHSKNLKESHILILTGPPGVGKTATVKAICKTQNAEMFVWSNKHQEKTYGINEDILSTLRDRISSNEIQSVTFNRFLLQSAKYSLYSDSKRIIVVEEFPNAFIKDSASFHNIIRKYASRCYCPVIFIISDNTKGESIESQLFPKELQFTLKMQNISFNAVAPTMLMKTLTKINNSSKVQSNYKKLNKPELESIASDCMGDIRNAINSMQFMCMSNFKKPQPLGKSKSTSSDENHSSKKDTSLFLFHALGKILYCKRDPALKSNSDVLPPEFKQFEKDPLISNPEEVFEKTSISAEAFTLFLQENFVHFVSDIDSTYECSSSLSEADLISASWSNRGIMNDYMVSLAARGLMFNLTPESAIKRWRALHKPQFYENNSKQKQLLKSLKHSFKGTSLSVRELQIDLIPFLSKLQVKQLNPAQITLSKELGEMNVKRFVRQTAKTLDEKDCFELNADDNDVEFSSPCKDDVKVSNENADQYEDEEIVIEEYDF